MIVIPAIDLLNGKCVRLYQGDFNQTEKVADDPFNQLDRFINDGAEIVHIVDLDGARDQTKRQYELIKQLCERATVPIQIGGGIRSIETVEQLIEAGASRLVIGTAALENLAFLKEAVKKYPDQIVVGIDAKNEKVATHGWETVSSIDYIEFAKKIESLGVKTIVFTDISKDGTMSGPNLDQLDKLNQAVNCKIVASGGISQYDDLIAVANLGIEEAIVGKAIYQEKITLKGARQLWT
ncbi:1-(5-phosphoribosyl)-5-[(5-phosphoribosylamino)methylideneamino]imidazole-4-carboxamide isomerase [Amphibacillus xylanus]|uniref:1-(5-phosphoribosyl)-5-[(5-phosphoribosylamino)methylideneamino] imidazole-4-carboxamide isomerase n=1 Tax=Amphibacillus xylanus (strain ATCC 51415 / DSM 6626 / JCM 7361 / LMG 17667 / NBRC 15112 / Ep01) TaxID=698758 RepID=K0IY92_AMPXN|nr:1-(5-phosphoribosyl)-5-[(5-phosphoribosylamino)methylideneamino]imidazole-4-carboxamide isomerase [Amphibacillus xylanus]BAM47475.1 1-(5-phosphoribosyl)-5-[(5-phosphoribosylamino) methylideneamino] imidazole-4-carboxamide isomerase [Amphibacillus xylanus NBRC 15112]